jgi:uncharacterized membrane protein YkvA (DUF1232 family)
VTDSRFTSVAQFPEPGDEPDTESFDAESFWAWLGRMAKKVGSEILEKALMALFVVLDPKTPTGARVILIAALAYLVLPVDAIPDFIPAAGFTDDLAALVAAIAAIADNIRVRHLRAAREQMNEWGIVIDLVPTEWDDDSRVSDMFDDGQADAA